jgi:hypothetical protein
MSKKNKQGFVINTLAEVVKLSGVEEVRITVATDRLTSVEGKSSF